MIHFEGKTLFVRNILAIWQIVGIQSIQSQGPLGKTGRRPNALQQNASTINGGVCLCLRIYYAKDDVIIGYIIAITIIIMTIEKLSTCTKNNSLWSPFSVVAMRCRRLKPILNLVAAHKSLFSNSHSNLDRLLYNTFSCRKRHMRLEGGRKVAVFFFFNRLSFLDLQTTFLKLEVTISFERWQQGWRRCDEALFSLIRSATRGGAPTEN